MKCQKCGNEMREDMEQVGLENGVAVYNRFAYCDMCHSKTNLDALEKSKQKMKNSTLSTWACICSLFGCTAIVGIILAIIDLSKKDKTTKHTGSYFALVFCGLYLILAISSANNANSKNTADNQDNIVVDISETEQKTEENTETQEPEVEELTIGSSFEVNGLRITINESDLEFTDYSDEYNLYTPSDGMKYIMVSLTYENIGDSDKYISIYDFNCYADNTLCEQAYLSDGSDFINANISTNRNMTFKIYFSVPIDAESIELEYDTIAWNSDKAVIVLK